MSILIILLVIAIFAVLVLVHELGHFVAARRNGVEVEEFGLGFPPRAFGRKIGRTLYSINWLPLGGFVKLKGEDSSDTGPGTFGGARFLAKTKILFAGVTMNLLTAYIILVVLCLTGLPPVLKNQFSFGHPVYDQPKQVMVVATAPGSPAEVAGLQKGDVILSANGQPLESEQQLLDFTKSNAGQTVNFEVTGDSGARRLQTTLRGAQETQGQLGVTPMQTYKLQYTPVDAVITAAGLTLQMVWETLAAFGGLVAGLLTQGQLSEQVAGPVGIVSILANVAYFGAAYIFIFVASISISLAVLNALPLPALDGGRWLLIAAQKFTGRKLSERFEVAVHTVGFVSLIALMIVVTFVDIQRLN